ncbi:hypothetical protein TNCT_554441 [Trichonephila clavata]|uniref:Uncharacterized protein n=1 Tax=Trichonephila clavata TaxID=2740835 RepID=A0A8X6G7N8_TRICU|nr:hypothetical protein TNCT_554441 [Trichonephila clavata]
MPSNRASISMLASELLESVRFALSQAVLSLRRDLALDLRSLRCLRLNSSTSGSPFCCQSLLLQMSVASCRSDFKEGSFINCQDRYIKSSTTQIKNENILFPSEILVKSIGQGCCCGFIDDSQYI